MPVYSAPVRDTKFVLDHIVELGRYDNLSAFANASSDIVEAILEEGGRRSQTRRRRCWGAAPNHKPSVIPALVAGMTVAIGWVEPQPPPPRPAHRPPTTAGNTAS